MEKAEVFDQNYSKYYNVFYNDKNYPAEVAYVDRLIREFSNGGNSVVEYGSGTGGHGILFREKGYDLVGIERSEQMAAVARQRGLECVVADITTYTVNRKFDVCLALFHVISYINDNDSLLKVFSNTRKHLNSGGIFIFDVWFTPAVMNQLPEVRVKKLENDETTVLRIAQPVTDFLRNTVDVRYNIILRDKKTGAYSEFSESHPMRHFGVPEIQMVCAQTGFTMIRAEEFLTGENPSEKTWGVTFILKAND